MTQRILHGNISPTDVANALQVNFNSSSYQVRTIGNPQLLNIQIATLDQPQSGGKTALTVRVEQAEDGVVISIGQQDWIGLAASLGKTAFQTFVNPLSLFGRLDDLAQDVESIQLNDKVIKVIDSIAQLRGAGYELSERLRRIECAYCSVANPVGKSHCISCGAPLGSLQPQTCKFCGFVVKMNEEVFCPNCKNRI